MTGGLEKNGTFGRIADLPISPREYYDLVRNFNRLIQQELSKKLLEHSDRLGTVVTLITPGSDGRQEKGSQASPLEVIALLNSDIDTNIFNDTITQVLQETASTRISRMVEVKTPLDTLRLADNGRTQPGRIADSRLLYGKAEDVRAAKQRLGHEIIVQSNKEIVGKVVDLVRDARHTTQQGRNKIAGADAIHFDIETGTVFFNPDAYQLSFKIGPLRLVQNKLLVEEIKYTRAENKPNFISTLNSGILPRLDKLSDDSMINLSKQAVREIMNHYAFFLRLYHRSEQAYEHSEHTQIALQLTPSETEEVAKRLQALSELMESFKIQPTKRDV